MIPNQQDHPSPTPFLAQYASVRTSSRELQGYYSKEFAMWVVAINGREIPLIDYINTEVELATKTKVEQESDDQEDMFAMIELSTKTESQPEQDDAGDITCFEIVTKTDAQTEQDDTSSDISGMFL